jgi:hypothetical protein
MNEMKPCAGAGGEIWCGWKSEVLQHHRAFSVPVDSIFTLFHVSYYEGKSENNVPYFIATK